MVRHYYSLDNMNDAIAIALIVHCGSMIESTCERGYSHLLEHMLISFDKFHHNPYIKCIGYTDFYYTYYIFLSSKEYEAECMRYIDYIQLGEYLTNEALEEVRKDVLKEYQYTKESRRNSEYCFLLKDTNYIEHLAIGNIDVIERSRIHDLKYFFMRNYSMQRYELLEVKEELIKHDVSKKTAMRLTPYIINGKGGFEWINFKKGNFLNIYFLQTNIKSRIDSAETYLFCVALENIVSDILGNKKVIVKRIRISCFEDFICLGIPKGTINNLDKIFSLITLIVNKADCKYLKSFFEEYERLFLKYLEQGYGINILREVDICIKNLIFDKEIKGTKEFYYNIRKKLNRLDIEATVHMFGRMRNLDPNFYLYKIIER